MAISGEGNQISTAMTSTPHWASTVRPSSSVPPDCDRLHDDCLQSGCPQQLQRLRHELTESRQLAVGEEGPFQANRWETWRIIAARKILNLKGKQSAEAVRIPKNGGRDTPLRRGFH